LSTGPAQDAQVALPGTTARTVGVDWSSTGDSTLVIRSSAGDEVFRQEANAYSGTVWTGPVRLAAGRDYVVSLTSQEEGTHSYTVAVRSVPADVTGTVSVDGPAIHLRVTAPGQHALVSVPGKAGDVVAVSLTVPQTPEGVDITMADPHGDVVLGWYADAAGGPTTTPAVTLPVDGRYTLTLAPGGHGVGAFSVRVFTVGPEPSATVSIGGPAVRLTTVVPGQSATFTFTGTRNTVIQLVGGQSGIDAFSDVSVVAPDGTQLTQLSLYGNSSATAVQRLDQTGTYTVRFTSEDLKAGVYSLRVGLVAVDPVVGATVGGPQVSVRTTSYVQWASVVFDGVAGTRISSIYGATGTGGEATGVALIAPDGSVLSTDTVFDSQGFADALVLPVTGRYTVQFYPGGAGTFSAQVYAVPADATATVTPDGGPVHLTLSTPGQGARATFTGTTDQRVTFSVDDSDVGHVLDQSPDAIVRLLAPDGSQVATLETLGGTSDPITLRATGRYTVTIDPLGAFTATFAVSVTTMTPDAVVTTTIGGPVVHVSTTIPGQRVSVHFHGRAGDRIGVEWDTSGTTSGQLIQLVGPDGYAVGKVGFSNAGTQVNWLEAIDLTETGTYTALIAPGAGTGTYSISVVPVPPDLERTTTLSGPPVTVSVVQGQAAHIHLTFPHDGQVVLRVTGAGTTSYTDVQLRDPIDGGFASFNLLPPGSQTITTQPIDVYGNQDYTLELVPGIGRPGTFTVTVLSAPASA
jgi:hypothetical protein